jgi:hypothetical protein
MQQIETHGKQREAGEAGVGKLKPSSRREEKALPRLNPVANLLSEEVPVRD